MTATPGRVYARRMDPTLPGASDVELVDQLQRIARDLELVLRALLLACFLLALIAAGVALRVAGVGAT